MAVVANIVPCYWNNQSNNILLRAKKDQQIPDLF